MSRVETIYLIHHSHTDVGYTHDQPIVWELQGRFIEEAIRLAEKYAESSSDGAFRWTVESTAMLYHWLQHAPQTWIDRFIALERAGRIEVTGMFANLTPLFDTDQLVETFQLLRTLRDEYGFTVRYAMNCDVNGENWPLVDLLLDLGFEGFSMAINVHFGGAPVRRPNAFWWEGPSGRKILTWNGWPYNTGLRFGIGRDAEEFEKVWWPRVERYLAEIEYPLPVLMVQSYHPFGDNAPAFEGFSTFIDEWNAQGKSPQLRMATPSMWWEAVKEHSHLLPTYRGDWTDYWNFGCISSAREQAMNRASRVRLRTADALAAAVQALGEAPEESQTSRSFARYREQAWYALHLWDEHTWGADCSVRAPESEDTLSQWHHKAGYAYTARSLSLLLQRDALAELAQRVERSAPTDLLVFNPLPWPRWIAGEVPSTVRSPRGVPEDATSGRHFQDRVAEEDALLIAAQAADGAVPEGRFLLKPTEVPGFGYTVISQEELIELRAATEVSEDAVVENERHRLTFDRERGGILSWYDKAIDHEWVDQSAGYPFNGFVHEEVADTGHPWPRNLLFEMEWVTEKVERPRGWKPGWRARRRRPEEVIVHRVYHTPLGCHVVQILRAPGCAGLLRQRVFLPNFADYIECEAWWEMGLKTHPEATYLLYPFNIPDARVRIDLGGQAMEPEADQLPGVCRDYFTVQGWVDFSNERLGVIVATPENPMVQFSDFHFGHNQTRFSLERATLLGWVTNNYWETNFRAHQPGRVHARYRILPYRGGFDEARAHRCGLEAAHGQPLVQHLGEPRIGSASLPPTGTLLRLPGSDAGESPILTLHVKPAERRAGIVVRLLNAGDEEQTAEIGSGLLRIVRMQRCDLLERELEPLPVQEGNVCVALSPRQITTVHLEM